MDRRRPQLSVAGMLGVVACVALNVWLFRLGPLLGILGLNVTKHVLIAYLCQYLGVNQQVTAPPPRVGAPSPRGEGAVAPARPFTSAP